MQTHKMDYMLFNLYENWIQLDWYYDFYEDYTVSEESHFHSMGSKLSIIGHNLFLLDQIM